MLRNMVRAQSWLVILSLVMAPMLTLGQTTAGDWSAVRQLPNGAEVEVRSSGSKSKGRIRSVTDTAVELEIDGRVVDIGRTNVERIYRLGGRDRKKGALVGAIVGGGAGVAAGAGIYAQGDFIGGIVPIFGAIGAGIGAGVGAIFGRAKKELVYQR